MVGIFQGLPGEVITFFAAMTPIGELRAAIPLGIHAYSLPVFSAVVLSIIGNMVPAVIIIFGIEKIVKWFCGISNNGARCYSWVAKRTVKKFESSYAKYGASTALMLFVAVPLPLTGAWTGALAAFLFGIPKRIACLFIFFGVCIAAALVTLIDLGIVRIFS